MDRYKFSNNFSYLLTLWIYITVFHNYGASAARVTSVSPRYGSLAGETRLTIYGSDFSGDQFSQNDDPNTGNFVYLVGESGSEFACPVHKDGTTEDQIMCYTPDKMPEQTYHVKVVVDGNVVADADLCWGNPTSWNCAHIPRSANTPTITTFSPQSATPEGFVDMYGKLFTDRYGSNMETASNSKTERMLRVYVGPTECLLKDGDTFYGLTLDSETSDNGNLRCLAQGKSIGFFNASYIVDPPYGRSQVDSDLYRVSYNDQIHMLQVYTNLSSVSPSTGSTAGGLTLTIYGDYFDNRAPYTAPRAYVGDTECVVTNVVIDEYIECTVAADPQSGASSHAGNRGVNFEYWTSTSTSLDDILSLTSSSSGYVSSWLDETYHYDDSMDTYVSKMTTYFTPPHTGDYQFQLKGDDSAKLFIDGSAVLTAGSSWAYSSNTRLTANTRYLIVVVHKENSGSSYVHLRAKFLETLFTHFQLGKAKQEQQTLSISSTIVFEEQELTFSGFSNQSYSQEIQDVSIDTDGDFRLGLFGVFTEPIDISYADDIIVGDAINALPVFSSDESVTVVRKQVTSGTAFTFTFVSKRGDFPDIEVEAGNNGTGVTYQVSEQAKGSPDLDALSLTFAGRVSDPFSASDLSASSLQSVVSGMFSAKCPDVFESASSSKVYLDYESGSGPFSGSITKETDAFCGRYSLVNPSRIYSKDEDDLGISVSQYGKLCFAYKGVLRDTIWLYYSYIDGTTSDTERRTNSYSHTFSKDSSTSSNTWYYTCIDIYDKILSSRPSDLNHRVEQIWVARDNTEDFYIDSLYIGNQETTTDDDVVKRRLAPAIPNGSIIKSESVTETSTGMYKITLEPYECGNQLPLFELTHGRLVSGGTTSASLAATFRPVNGNTASLTIQRKNEASPPVEGFVDITFNGNTRSRLNISLEAEQFQTELETLNGIGGLSVSKNGDCANFDLVVVFETLSGDQPQMQVNYGSLSGIDAAGSISTNVNGGLFYDPLTGDMLSTVHSKPQVRLYVNDVPLACTGNCDFEWDSGATPTVTGASPGSGTSALGTTVTVSGTGFSLTKEDNSVTIGGVACSVSASTGTSITCDVGNGPVGSHKVVVTVKDKGSAAHASGDVTFEYTADISGIAPTTGSLGGGLVLTINGYGFKTGATVTINSQSCAVRTIEAAKITCIVPPQSAGGTYDVVVTSGSTTLTHSGYNYDPSLTPTVNSVNPATIGVAGDRLTIAGSSFGATSGTVTVGSQTATVVSWADNSVVVDVGPIDAGTQEVKVETLSGSALLSSNAMPSISVDLSISNVYPLQGSTQGGTKLTIAGSGFGTNVTLVDVAVDDVSCDIDTLTNTEIVCQIANAGRVHSVTNRGTHRSYGIYYAFDQPYLTINLGDYVHWSWETPSFVNNVNHAIYEVESPSALEAKAGGFSSGTPSPNGQFQYQFSETGTYYVWSGYVDQYLIKNYVGTIEVVNAVSSLAEVDVQIAGKSAQHNVGGSSNPSDTSSCQSIINGKSGCSDALPTGGDSSKFNFAFWTCSTPIINSVSEQNGTTQTDIVLQGEGLSSSDCQNEIMFGNAVCAARSSSSSSVTCRLDKTGEPDITLIHPVSVRVGNRGNALINIMAQRDRSLAVLPNIDSIEPQIGSLAGGAVLTINGYGFGSSPMVTVGGYTCDIVSNTYSQILCETPASSSEATRDVEVSVMINGSPLKAECQTASTTCVYIYSQSMSPSVTAIDPAVLSGPTTFTINGTLLGTATADLDVSIGGVSATVSSASDTQIQATLSNAPVGSNAVVVKVGEYGKASGSLTMTGVPLISSVSPALGSIHGEQLITIQGNGFVDGQTTVTLDGADCNITMPVSLSEIICLTKAHAAESVNLVVTSNSVSYTAETYDFSLGATPTISSVNPTFGLAGSTLTIAGSNLGGSAISVLLDDAPCLVTYNSSSEIRCTLGGHATGLVPVSVHVAEFGASNTDVQFEYELSLGTVSPTQGGTSGGQRLTLTGSGFTSDASVTVCNQACTVLSATTTELVCRTPAVSAQVCAVAITVNGLTKTKGTAYTYDASLVPTVTGVTPRRGGTGGGTTITVSGSGFGTDASSAKVYIDGAECIIASAVTDSTIICETGPHQGSLQTSVEVEIGGNGIGQESTPGDADFEYIDVWSSNFTWGGGPLPGAGEFIVIPKGQTVLLDTDTPVFKFLLIQGGSLIFDDKDVELNAEIIMITDNGLLQVGTEAQPFQHKGIITLHGHHRSKELPIYGTKVLAVRNGTLDLHGIEVPLTWTRLASTASSGSTTLELVDPVEWNVGDEIVIAATGHHHTQSDNEKKTITAISQDKRTLTLDSALSATHVGEEETFDGTLVEFRGEVGLLTHNVVVRGNTDPQWEDEIEACPAGFNTGEFATQTCFLGRFGDEIGSSQFGGMILVHSPVKDTHEAEAKLSYVEVTFGGQAFRLGRYPVHFHLNGDMSTSYVRGCGIHKTFNRAVNIHGTHNTIVEKTVIYDIMGGAFFLEDGIETGNTFQYNLAVFVRESSSLLNDDVTPASFWLTNPNNTVQHNAAAGGTHFGYWYRMHDHPDGPSFTTDVCCKNIPLGVFNNNSAHSFGWFGLWIFPDYFPLDGGCGGAQVEPAVFRGLFAWNNDKGAESVNTGALQFEDFVLVQNKKAGYEGKMLGSVPAYTDDSPMVKDSLIVGKTTVIPDGTQGCTNGGIVFPYGVGFRVKNVRFVNFAESGCACMGWARITGTCSQGCGGFSYHTEELSFINAPNRGVYAWEWEGVIVDKDGTASGKPAGWQIIPTTGSLPPDCEPLASFSTAFPASVCPPTYKFHRFAFNNPTPTALEGKNFIIKNQYGNSTIPFLKKRITHPFGWMCDVIDGEDYEYSFENAEQITNTSYTGSYYDFEATDYIAIKLALKEVPDRVSLDGGNTFINYTVGGLDPATAKNGDWEWINSERKIRYLVHGTQRSKRSTTISYGVDRPLSFTTFKCYYTDCIPPPDPNTVPPADTPPLSFDYWDDATLWNDTGDGYITNDVDRASSYGVPLDMDNVKILYGSWVVLNGTNPAKLGTLLLEGTLEVIDNIGFQYELKADFIIIKGGRLIAGWSYDPFETATLSIILSGNHSSPTFNEGDGPNVGSKAIGVFGGLDLFGKDVGVAWTQLAASAAAGANQIVLKDQVTWSAGDEIVLGPTSYDVWETETFRITAVAADNVTLTLNDTLQYKHVAHSETINGQSIELGAAVGLLTRTIKIIGEDYDKLYKQSFGARVIVGLTIIKGQVYTGYARLSNVEFYHSGQEGWTESYDPRFSVAYVATGTVSDIKPSFVKKCSFWNGFNSAIGAFGIGGLNITDNVVHHTVGNGIVTSSDDTRIINNMVALMIWTGAYQDRAESFNFRWEAGIEAMDAKNVILQDNLVTGSERIGIHAPPLECGVNSSSMSNNRVQSNFIGYGILPADETDVSCVQISGFTSWKNHDFGLYYQGPQSAIITDNVVVDNRQGIFTTINGPNSLAHLRADKTVEIKNSLIVGATASFDCSTDVSPSGTNVDLGVNGRPAMAPSGGMIGVVFPNFLKSSNAAPVKPFAGIKSYPAIAGLMKLTDLTFAHYSDIACRGDYAVATSGKNDDGQHPVEAERITFVDVPENNKIVYHRPNVGKINSADCVDMDCDAFKKALFKDLDGTFLGSVGAVIPQSEFEWDGDPRRGLGDYRIPKEMVTTIDGTRIPYQTLMPNKGIIRSSNCTYMSSWQSYKCFDYNYEMLIIESMDADTETRRVSPVAILGDGYIDLINGPQDHGWCSGYTCRKRLSTFMAIVATDQEYLMHFTGTTPEHLRYHLLNTGPNDAIKLTVWYAKPNRLDVFVNGQNLMATNAEINSQGYYVINKPVANEYTPMLANQTGTNYCDRDTGLMTIIIKGPTVIDVTTNPMIIVSFGLPGMSVQDFYGQNLIENIAGFFNIPLTKVRIVNVVSASSSGRKRRTTDGINVEVEIGDEPASDVNSTASNSIDQQQLINLASEIVNECQVGNVSSNLNISGSCESVEVPSSTSESNSVTYSTPSPAQLVFHHEPTPIYEGYLLTQQPKVQATDLFNVVVTELGTQEYPWQLTVSIRDGTGHPDASLNGVLTVNASNGWFNFTDLEITHMGTGYILDFNVTFPTVAENFTLESQPFTVPGRPIKPNILPMSLGAGLKPSNQFAVSLDLRDSNTNQPIPDITWRSHSWTATARVLGNPKYGGIGGIQSTSFDTSTGVATFPDLRLTHFGFYYVQFRVVSSPPDYNMTINRKMTIKNPKFDGLTLEEQSEISMKFNVDYDTILSDEDKENEFEQTVAEEFANKYLDVNFDSSSIRRGSIVITFVIGGNSTDVNSTAYALCDSVANSTSFDFNGYTLSLSTYMTVNNETFYGVNCHQNAAAADDDDELHPGIIAAIVISALIIIAVIVGLIVWKMCVKPKTQTHNMKNTNTLLFNQDQKTGNLYFKEDTFSSTSGATPAPPISTLYTGPYIKDKRPLSGISVHMRTPDPEEARKLERHLQTPESTMPVRSPSPGLLDPRIASVASYVEPSDPRSPSPSTSNRSSSPKLSRSHSPFSDRESPLPPVGENLYNSDYIRVPTPKATTPYLPAPSPQPSPKASPKVHPKASHQRGFRF